MLNVYEELGDASRRLIVCELSHGPKSVSDIVRATGLKQPNVSNHLARMRDREVVRATKLGRHMFYSLASPSIEAIVQGIFRSDRSSTPTVPMEKLYKQYAKAAIQGDEPTCFEILEIVCHAHLPLVEIYAGVLAPAICLADTWYQAGTIDEAQMHLATNITERAMTRAAGLQSPVAGQGRVAVLGCASGSQHTIGIRMVSDFLQSRGWRSLFVGAGTPQQSFVNVVNQHRPSLVLVGCSTSAAREATFDLLRALKAAKTRGNPYLIGVGGVAVREDLESFLREGADFATSDLREFECEYLPALEAKHI